MSVGLDPNLLLSFYQSKLTTSSLLNASQTLLGAQRPREQRRQHAQRHGERRAALVGDTAADQNAMDAKVLSTTNFLDTSNVPVLTPSTADGKTEQDNQKLFSLYSAVNTLAYIAKMGQRPDMTAGQLAGLNARFQTGLSQVQSFISKTAFNNFTLQAANPSASVTSSVVVPFGSFDYATKTLTSNANLGNVLPGLSTADSFTIAVKKGSTTTNVAIDLSQIAGPLTLDNVVSYVNQTLSAGGFSTRFQKVLTGGTLLDPTKATYGLQVSPGGSEQVSLSSADATPSLYIAGSTGQATATTTSTKTTSGTTATASAAADQQGRLLKLSDLDTSPTSTLSVNAKPTSGTTTAQATVVDGSGNVYVVGNATGDFGNQINQGQQDAYLTKYDSAGNVLWQRMLGSSGTASGTTLALDPTGGVVIAGSDNAPLTTTSVNNGNVDTFVSKYDANGNQTWVKQLQTLSQNQAASVSVDTSGNVFIGGQVSGGVIGSGQTKVGAADAYVAKLDKKGNVVYEQQFGTTSTDSVAATASAADGSLYVASVQNGHAIVSKYANGDARTAPVWTQDLGDLQNGGAIGGLTVSGNQLYISGTTQNAALTAGGAATVANASSGGSDAFVFNLTDQGSPRPRTSSPMSAPAARTRAAASPSGPDGTVYLTGTTNGTFAGQTRNVASVTNMFATALEQRRGRPGPSSMAASTASPAAPASRSIPRAPACSTRSACRAARSIRTRLSILPPTRRCRAGDPFQIQFSGTASRTATITHRQGRDAPVACHQDQHPDADGRRGIGELHRRRRGPEDRGQSAGITLAPRRRTEGFRRAGAPRHSRRHADQSRRLRQVGQQHLVVHDGDDAGLRSRPRPPISTSRARSAPTSRAASCSRVALFDPEGRTRRPTPRPAPVAGPGIAGGTRLALPAVRQIANATLALNMLTGGSAFEQHRALADGPHGLADRRRAARARYARRLCEYDGVMAAAGVDTCRLLLVEKLGREFAGKQR